MRRLGWFVGFAVLCAVVVGQDARAGWETTTTASGVKWVNGPKAGDADPASYAVDQRNATGLGEPLVLDYGTGVLSNRIRFSADRWSGAVDYVTVTATYSDGSTEVKTFYALKDGQPVAEAADDGYPNASYKEFEIKQGVVIKVAFQFHYTKAGFFFWLYGLHPFKIVTPVIPPAGRTLEPTNVNATSAVLHGMVAHEIGDASTTQADGGEPCTVSFQYGKTTAYGSIATASYTYAAGNEVVALAPGLETGATYHYRVKVHNSAGDAFGSDKTFVACPEESDDGAVWVSPVADYSETHVYGGTNYSWETPEAAYDDWDASAARCYHMIKDPELWSPCLLLTPRQPGLYNGVRFKAAKIDGFVDAIQILVYKSDGWQEVYCGPFGHNTLEVKSFDLYPITNCAVRFHMSTAGVGAYWSLYEFDFRQVGVNLVIPGMPYHREEKPGEFLSKGGEAVPVAFHFGPGIEQFGSGLAILTWDGNFDIFRDAACTKRLAPTTSYGKLYALSQESFQDELVNKTLYLKGKISPGTASTVSCLLEIEGVTVRDRAAFTVFDTDSIVASFGGRTATFVGNCQQIASPWGGDPGPAIEVFFREVAVNEVPQDDRLIHWVPTLNPADLLVKMHDNYWTSRDGFERYDSVDKWFNTSADSTERWRRPSSWDPTYKVPLVGGLYKSKFRLGASRTEIQILLPLAGADITDWLTQEVIDATKWGMSHHIEVIKANYSIVPGVTQLRDFYVWCEISGAWFDYILYAKDGQAPCPKYTPQETCALHMYDGGRYGYVTLGGKVVFGSKVNNLLWAAFGRGYGFDQVDLLAGAQINSIIRSRTLDSTSSQNAIKLGSSCFHIVLGFLTQDPAEQRALIKQQLIEGAGGMRVPGEFREFDLWPCKNSAGEGSILERPSLPVTTSDAD